MDLVSSVKNAVLNAAFPQACHVCRGKVARAEEGVACIDCWSQTSFFDQPQSRCSKCGAPSPTSKFSSSECPACRDHTYDLARATAVYEKAMSASILHLKRLPVIPSIILNRFPNVLTSEGLADCDVIVPVPLSKKRRTERGFNQAEVIALAVSRTIGVQVDSGSMIRKIHTPMHRAAMDKKAREMTVKNAFEVIRPKLIAGKSILLVDDIYTSGATASYCAKALKKRGAANVSVFTLARAV